MKKAIKKILNFKIKKRKFEKNLNLFRKINEFIKYSKKIYPFIYWTIFFQNGIWQNFKKSDKIQIH